MIAQQHLYMDHNPAGKGGRMPETTLAQATDCQNAAHTTNKLLKEVQKIPKTTP